MTKPFFLQMNGGKYPLVAPVTYVGIHQNNLVFDAKISQRILQIKRWPENAVFIRLLTYLLTIVN